MNSFEVVFPAIRGLQAGHAYYVSMCPLRLIPRIFLFDEEEVSPELRAQRRLNTTRIPEMADYIVEQRDSYVFSAITASIDGEVEFEPLTDDPVGKNIGRLHIPMSAKFVINDGQHRRAAIEQALKQAPELGDETIAVVFFLDPGLKRCQQMFADLNRYAVRPSPSLSILYDHRDRWALIAKEIVRRASIFSGTVELERSSLAARSARLFTLSSVQSASKWLLKDLDEETPIEDMAGLGACYWDAVADHIPDWQLVRERKIASSEVRQDRICAHAVTLAALGHLGRALLRAHPVDWAGRLGGLADVDWRRDNTEVWEGRAMIGGRVSKARTSVSLTTAVLKRAIGLPLSPEEARLEAKREVQEESR